MERSIRFESLQEPLGDEERDLMDEENWDWDNPSEVIVTENFRVQPSIELRRESIDSWPAPPVSLRTSSSSAWSWKPCRRPAASSKRRVVLQACRANRRCHTGPRPGRWTAKMAMSLGPVFLSTFAAA
jgi:hypothetical protein